MTDLVRFPYNSFSVRALSAPCPAVSAFKAVDACFSEELSSVVE